MKTCKKYLFPLVAITLCMMMLLSVPAAMADDPVVAEPTVSEVYTTTELDVGGIVGDLMGDVDPTLGDEIRDGAYEAQGILRYFTELIDKISEFFGNLLNAILGGLS